MMDGELEFECYCVVTNVMQYHCFRRNTVARVPTYLCKLLSTNLKIESLILIN